MGAVTAQERRDGLTIRTESPRPCQYFGQGMPKRAGKRPFEPLYT